MMRVAAIAQNGILKPALPLPASAASVVCNGEEYLCFESREECSRMLRWSPPAQTNPTIIHVADDVSLITLRRDEDAIIIPPNRIRGPLQINYGRHIRMIGAHFKGVVSATVTKAGVLRYSATQGSVFQEGTIIDADNQYGLDGLLVGGLTGEPGPDVYVQNCVIKNTYSGTDGLHADGFQYYGTTKTTRFDKVSITGQYQGVFLDPQHKIDAIDMRRVDMRYTDPATGEGYLFFLNNGDDKAADKQPVVTLRDVYVGERAKGAWEKYSIFPSDASAKNNVRKGDTVSFPNLPNVSGFVTRGAPVNGRFVDESTIGIGYQSPGYIV